MKPTESLEEAIFEAETLTGSQPEGGHPARDELTAIRNAVRVMFSPHDYTFDEYVKARDLLKTLAKEES